MKRVIAAGSFRILSVSLAGLLLLTSTGAAAESWEPAEAPLMTEWAEQVGPDNVWPEYPRPQLVRENWTNLNGLWDYAIRPREDGAPAEWSGRILIPFAPESALSGVGESVGTGERLWYRRTFEKPELAEREKLLLHFGAVDWETVVYVNDEKVGEHRGGYDPFHFDVTDALVDGENEIVVAVWDPVDEGSQPRGKQVLDPRGIWYTDVTGIWQTVWMEKVPRSHIRSLRIEPDVDDSSVVVRAYGATEGSVEVSVLNEGETVSTANGRTGRPIRLPIEDADLWSPDSPHLYDLEVRLLRNGETVDRVTSYFGMRKIEVREDESGVNRLFLNDEPLFHYGLLDQGWWPDGLYTAPTDEALRYDLEVTRDLGFNMARKHVKIEPARWYYWADKLGVLVWQDLPNGGEHPEWLRDTTRDGPEIVRDAASEAQWQMELERMIETFYNHPSIVVWVPFNERWGQFNTEQVTNRVRRLDPTRLVDSASGGNFRGVGDILDIHTYPGPAMGPLDPYMAAVQGEFGGLALPVPGHTWIEEGGWGYVEYEDSEEFNDAYLSRIERLPAMISQGLAAAVYTQTTDVEGEINGVMTYDRRVVKLDDDRVSGAHARLYETPRPAVTRELVAAGGEWRYTREEPVSGWNSPDFDDSEWESGAAPFGRQDIFGDAVGTRADQSPIWLRRSFEIEEVPDHLMIDIHYNHLGTVYINGAEATAFRGFVDEAVAMPAEPAAVDALRPGTNTVSLHIPRTPRARYIDVGLRGLYWREAP